MSLRYLDSDTPLKRYLEIKAEMKALDAELKALQPLILAALWEEPEQQASYAGYDLNIGTRRSYDYSEHIQAMEQELRQLKKQEEAAGVATLKRHTSFVIVRATDPADGA